MALVYYLGMKLIVVTPTLGSSAWLAETVRSVAALPFHVQHILVAPGEVAPQLRASFPSATIVEETGTGMYGAINSGAAAGSNWDLLTYINDDDTLLPGFRFAVERAFRNRHLPFLAYGRVKLIDSAGKRIGIAPVSPFPALNRALLAQRIDPLCQQGSVVTRSAWEQLGGYDTSLRLCSDFEFLARACLRGVHFHYVNRTVACFRLRPGQLSKSRRQMEDERQRIDDNLQLLTRKLTGRHLLTRAIFKAFNTGVYLERIARHGFRSSSDLVSHLS